MTLTFDRHLQTMAMPACPLGTIPRIHCLTVHVLEPYMEVPE